MIVILGHSGFIGRHLLGHFSRAGREVIGIASRECDLTQPDRVRRCLAQLEAPFDLIDAAVINRHLCQDYPAFLANCQMLQNVLDSLPAGLCRSFIYLSSVDVYGRPAGPINEATLPAPAHYYALAKLTCEQLLHLFPKGFPTAILRLPGVYGVEDGGRSLVGKLVRAAVSRRPLTIAGSGRLRRDYIGVDDLAAVVDALVARPRDLLVNVATGRSLSLLDIVAIIADKAQCRPEIVWQPEDGPPGVDLVFDPANLRQALPTIRLRSLEEGIAGYLAGLAGEEATAAGGRDELSSTGPYQL